MNTQVLNRLLFRDTYNWIYFFFASFCFIANFNALYTRFMRTDIYTTELRDINEKFNKLETDIEAKLNFFITDPRIRQQITGEVGALRMQITDPKNLGKGDRADLILGRIERLLGAKLTPLTPISTDKDGYSDLANRYEEQIIQKMENLSPDEKNLKNNINNAVLKWNRDIQNLLLLSSSEINDMAQGQIDKALTEYNRIGNRAHTILGDDKIKFTPAFSKTQEVGKIGYAFNHAIRNFGMFQLVVLAGCILLDFGILIIILLMPTDHNEPGPGGTSKRKGKTLIPTN